MPKTFVLAPDSFKESMTALEACHAMQTGLQSIFPDARFILCPMADGGEGTVDALVDAKQGQRINLNVSGPLTSQQISTYFGLINHGKTAVIEMAKANGIHLLSPKQRNPLLTSTFGTGEMIRAALDHGVTQIIIGLGGSVTNDAGMGMAVALGAKFLDHNQQIVNLGGGYLDQIQAIDINQLDPRLKNVEIIIANDVSNPLLGDEGATRVFGPQKGANAEMIEKLESNLTHFADLIEKQLNIKVKDTAGAGAAGGLAAGLLAFTPAKIQSGVETIIEHTNLKQAIQQADYVFTGEGAIDFQTKFGKTPIGVARIAKQYNKPVFVCAGYLGKGIETLYQEGITAIFGILNQCSDLETALENGSKNLSTSCENIGRLICALNP
ncbi:glycerate kinase [Acinetobacter sp. S40]|uniref:glycerate kinase family protein n=1 Tax=unclassified Acinetobacter TaxID=196816 RepID=UPI00190A7918|nr:MULTISPECIES: glycerate kinase [unclassified Acinetobacter]MBJ9985388.1 glycerate kinase [Acinetobacter sp. S40]MBK0063738.1 glycerate kinase [Acinetobacter sp. S55]MBK0066973.1 glycerate kinase [Acinetobacter sp. S54]